MSLVPYKRNPAEEKKILEELLKEAPGGDDLTGTGIMTKMANGNYTFTSIPYQGEVIPFVELSPEYLEKGASKTQADWAKFSKKDGWWAADIEILYQCLSRAYALRSDAKHQKTVQEFRTAFHKIFNPSRIYLGTLTKVSYGKGLNAVISSLGPFPRTEQLPVLEFTRQTNDWSYLILTQEQPESQLGKTNPLPLNALPIMKSLLGKDYEQAGAVFQYFSTLTNKNLRETRLWTPTSTNRNKEWVVALGVNVNGLFSLDTSGYTGSSWPALGVRFAHKSSTENKG